MNKEQWDTIVTGVLDFNRLITTPEERKTEAYYIKSCNLLDEEYYDEFHVHWEEWVTQEATEELRIKLLDDVCDVLVVGIQATDINTPSSLSWDYIQPLLDSGTWHKHKDVFISPMLDVMYASDVMSFNLFPAMCEVIRSNNTKIPTLKAVLDYYGCKGDHYEDSIESAILSACDWIMDQIGEEWQVTGSVVIDTKGVERVVFRDKNLKVRKPWCFEEPNLISCL